MTMSAGHYDRIKFADLSFD